MLQPDASSPPEVVNKVNTAITAIHIDVENSTVKKAIQQLKADISITGVCLHAAEGLTKASIVMVT
jgi:hypothetical protein